MRIIWGVDGCKGGWFVAAKDLDTQEISCQIIPNIEAVTRQYSGPQVIAIDIPIGLLDQGARQCDVEARKLLGPGRGSSVFPAPIRSVLDAHSYLEASNNRFKVEEKRISQQTWGIVPKIREVDEFLRHNPDWIDCTWEVHPEVSFCYLADNRPMQFSKKSQEGKLQRLNLLKPYFGEAIESAIFYRNHSFCTEDDVLDAFAALWTAERLATNLSFTFPVSLPVDQFGLRMGITA